MAGFDHYPVGAAVTVAELERDPHPALARLRASEPVSWVPALGGWLVTRHDLALAVMRDAATFTVDDPRFSTAQVIGPSMLSLDGDAHTRHRDAFARPFRPAATRTRFAAFVAAEVERLLAALRPHGAAELRADFAGPLAVAVVAEALGLDDVDAAIVRSWYESFVAAISEITAGGAMDAEGAAAGENDGARGQARERAAAAYGLLGTHVTAALARADDASLLVAAAGGDGPRGGLTPDEVVSNAAVLMFGGIDTTEGMITNAVLHLLGSGDVLDRVRTDRSLLAAAIEESARLEPAAAVVDRYATRDVRLAAARVRAGDLVRVSIAAANRDPAVFAAPDRFDPWRANLGAHLAFAHGPHFCFGAHLARLEAHTAINGLLDRLPGLRLDGTRPNTPHGLVFRKPPELQVRWDPTAATPESW
jgi:cytochrome P450